MSLYPARVHARKTFSHLLSLLPGEHTKSTHIILLSGGVTEFRNDTDRELSFRQESNFFYLTGCHVPGAHLLLSYTRPPTTPSALADAAIHSHLFIPAPNPADLMWSPPPPDLPTAARTHDVDRVSHSDAFPQALTALTRAGPGPVLLHHLPHSPLFPAPHPNWDAPDAVSTDKYLLPALHRARLIKTPEEVALIRHANAISSRAHEVVMRVLGLGVSALTHDANHPSHVADDPRPSLPSEWLITKEYEAEALFVASCRREGAVLQAYLPIVAGSVRAATLHYCCNDRELAWGPVATHEHVNDACSGALGTVSSHAPHVPPEKRELLPQVLLIDAGCEWSCYASDITRTMPVGNGGRFTKEAGEIYDLVRDMQTHAMGIIKAGIHWDDVHLLTHRVLVRGLLRLGILKAPPSPSPSPSSAAAAGTPDAAEATLLLSGITTAFYPHGLGHSLGLDVHDVPSASKPVDPAERGRGRGVGAAHERIYEFLRLRRTLEAGMVLTVEPGCYFHPHLLAAVRDSPHVDHAVLARYETGVGSSSGNSAGVGGVRIEDVVLVTADGHERLSTVRSDRAWVEALCGGRAP